MAHIGLETFNRSGLLGASALITLNLSHNALTEMPSNAFSDAQSLTEVDLSHNQIASMPWDIFKGSLGRVYLHNNNLTFIDSEWFRNLLSLETLTLNDNFLNKLDACPAFGTNIALRTLQLENNNFSSVRTTNPFGNRCFGQIDTFDISNNPEISEGIITVNAKTVNISNTNAQQCVISQDTFVLRAEHNRINSVQVELPNSNLRQLHFSHNLIDSADFLQGLEHVKIIDLSYNELTQMSKNVFENMLDLSRLDLSHNKFATIDFAFVKPARGLEYLDISNNLLSGSFVWNVEANALTTLNISNNNYTSLQHNLRKRMPRLTHIDLNNNFFNCEELTSLLLFLRFDNITAIIQTDDEMSEADNVRGIKCHQPSDESLESTKISLELTKEQLNKTIDDKLGNMEIKLIDLFRNMIMAKTMDSGLHTKSRNTDKP